MTDIKRMLVILLLIVAVLCGGCTAQPDSDEATEETTEVDNRTALERYMERYPRANLDSAYEYFDLALTAYACDFGVPLDMMPTAEMYVQAFLGSCWPVPNFRMLSAEYTLDYPEAIRDGYDLAIKFSYEDPMISDVLIYVGETNRYVEVDGRPEDVYCPAVIKEPSRLNWVKTQEQCIALGEAVLRQNEDFKDTTYLAGSLYYYLPELEIYPRFISCRYDKGMYEQDQPEYFLTQVHTASLMLMETNTDSTGPIAVWKSHTMGRVYIAILA